MATVRNFTQSSKVFALVTTLSLQTCCKRPRTVSGGKLEYPPVVPDNIIALLSHVIQEKNPFGIDLF